jgi:hypothetical protein
MRILLIKIASYRLLTYKTMLKVRKRIHDLQEAIRNYPFLHTGFETEKGPIAAAYEPDSDCLEDTKTFLDSMNP